MPTIYFYIKFFNQREYADEFLAGHLYLNPLRFFKTVEAAGDGRKDGYEASSHWYQPTDVRIKIAGFEIPSAELAGPVVIQPDQYDRINLLCMYAGHSGGFENLSDENIEAFRQYTKISDPCLAMGNWAIVVGNVTEFNRRFDFKIKGKGYGLNRGLVRYFGENEFSGKFDHAAFWKRSQFSWQREYRFVVETDAAEISPLRLEVGSLEDICTIFRVDQLKHLHVYLPGA